MIGHWRIAWNMAVALALLVCSPLSVVSASPNVGRIVLTQIPVASPAAPASNRMAARLPDGSRILGVDLSRGEANATVLTPGFHAAGHPDVSFDGRRILFVGRRTASDAQAVWEMNADGTGARLIVDRPEDCGRAIYLSTIYTMDAAAPVQQICFTSTPAGGQPAIHTCRMDGSRARQITFHPLGAWDPLLLIDGRLVFSVPRDGAATLGEGRVLMTINTDGTDIGPFAGVHEPPAWRAASCETTEGLVVYVESVLADKAGSPALPRGGRLVSVRRERSLRTRRAITLDATGVYCTPSAGPAGSILASHRRERSVSFGVCLVDAKRGSRAGVFDTPDWHEVDARLLTARRTPAGRSSVVDPRRRTGKLYCLDAYLCDSPAGKPLAKGKISRVEVIRASPGSNGDSGQTAIAETTLGEVPVEQDGSFFLELPAKMPFRLRTLDANGEVLRSMRSWMWVMPREGRGCIGCHEDRELSPPNRQPYAVRQPAHKIGPDADSTRPIVPARPKKKPRGGKGY